MNKLHLFFFALIALLAFSSCSDDDDDSIVGKWKFNNTSLVVDCNNEAVKAEIEADYDFDGAGSHTIEFSDNGRFVDPDGDTGEYKLKNGMIGLLYDDDKKEGYTEFDYDAYYSVNKNTLTLIFDETKFYKDEYSNIEGVVINKVAQSVVYNRQ